MSIKIAIPSHLQHLTSDTEVVEVNGCTVGECLDNLITKFPSMEKRIFNEDGELLDYVVIFVNREDSYAEGLATPVEDDDDLQIIYIIGGG